MNTMNVRRRGQHGFTIIEALISLVIMGFGILSLAGMQAALSRNADDAKQRTEAVRLAQEKIELFRSFTGITSTVVGQGSTNITALNWNALAATGTDPSITTNAVYARTWAMSGSSADPMRGLTVNVAWTDRAGDVQTISLSSVLSKSNPADSGYLGFPLPLNTNLKRPKNRNLDIPIPAIDLGNGESAVKFGEGGQYVLFGNISGNVVKICTPTLNGTPTSADIIAVLTLINSDTRNCTEITGFIVAGYVGRDSSVSNADWNTIESGLGIDYSGVTRNASGASGITCQFGNATNQNTGAIIANYKYYLCVVPLAAPSVNAPYNWSGTIRIAGSTAWNASGNNYYVCRYQYTATNSLTDVNQRNVQPYVAVNKSIDQQNYLLATTDNATSTTAPTCPASMTVANVSAGVLHQDCRSASNGSHATACPLLGATTPQYSVTYYGNNNTGGTAPAAASYASGTTVTAQPAGTLVKSGSTFAGWNTVANGSGVSRTVASTFAITADTTLYAQWTTLAPITYTVTYHGNGNTGGIAPLPASYASGAAVILPAVGTLTRDGYTFGGWSLSAGGSVLTSFAMPTSNTTLYSQWTTIPASITLGTPAPVWTGLTNPNTLTWLIVPNATGYLFSTCAANNNNSLTACTPTGSSSDTTRILSPAPGSKDTICYSVIAIGLSPYTNSPSSSVKCIFQKTSIYEYQ